jgi:glutamate synthase domain-containing protein 3
MSGGIAYIYDIDDEFQSRVNTELVDVVALDDQDLVWLERTIKRHRELTNSVRAGDVLANWEDAKTKICKVLPRDYARVIAEIEKAKRKKIVVIANG